MNKGRMTDDTCSMPNLAPGDITVRVFGHCKHDKTICYNGRCSEHKDSPLGIYLGSAIDNGSEGKLKEVENVLSNFGTVFVPARPFKFANNSMIDSDFIVSINEFALRQSDIAVFYWDMDKVSVGIPIEIYSASSMGKPVVLLCSNTSPADNSVYIRHYVKHVVSSIHQLVTTINDLLSGAVAERTNYYAKE